MKPCDDPLADLHGRFVIFYYSEAHFSISCAPNRIRAKNARKGLRQLSMTITLRYDPFD